MSIVAPTISGGAHHGPAQSECPGKGFEEAHSTRRSLRALAALLAIFEKFVLLGYALARFVDVLDAMLERFAFGWQ
jgi:hypothetical protein